MKVKNNPTGELYCDERLYGVKRWYYGRPENANMRVDDYITNSACFICVKGVDKYGAEEDIFVGTAFIMYISEEGMHFKYLVTAKHIIEGAKADGFTDIYVRLNKLAGGSEVIPLPDEWVYAENPAIDVAVLPFNPPITYFDFFPLPTGLGASDEAISILGIGIGDELLIVGLFNRKWGYGKNMPIVRSGIIAAMPDRREPFVTASGETYNAYLVEMRSISGLSGSPVFVLTDTTRPTKGEPDVLYYTKTLLLGMVRSHWDLERQDTVQDSISAKIDNDEIDRLNAGIAVVTPIQDIVWVLEDERINRVREQRKAERRKRNEPTPDSIRPKRQSENKGITQESFQDALKKASQKISSPDEEKSET